MSALLRPLMDLIMQEAKMGALPTLYAATAPDVEGGDYYGPNGFQEMRGYPKKVPSSDESQDVGIAKQLWLESENLTGVRFGALL